MFNSPNPCGECQWPAELCPSAGAQRLVPPVPSPTSTFCSGSILNTSCASGQNARTRAAAMPAQGCSHSSHQFLSKQTSLQPWHLRGTAPARAGSACPSGLGWSHCCASVTCSWHCPVPQHTNLWGWQHSPGRCCSLEIGFIWKVLVFSPAGAEIVAVWVW